MSLRHALLGSLADQPRTGYALLKHFEQSLAYAWHASHSQIYPELARLERAGLVKHTLVQQTARPDKKRYRITAAGRAAMRSWLASPIDASVARDEFSLRVFSMWLSDRRTVRAMLDVELARHEALLARHEKVEVAARQFLPSRARGRDMHFANYATLRRGVGYERHVVDWLRWLIAELAKG